MKRSHTTRKILAHLVLWCVLLSLAITTLGLIAIDGMDNIAEWSQWSRSNHAALLGWRLPLYAATVYGWYRMRLRMAKASAPNPKRRLVCAEVAAIGVLTSLELLTFRTN